MSGAKEATNAPSAGGPAPCSQLHAPPALILALAVAVDTAFARKSIIWRALAILLPLLWLASSLNFRWQPAHAKDDYRQAAALAAASLSENKEVWWAADAAAAYIYLTPIALEQMPGRLILHSALIILHSSFLTAPSA